MDKVIPFRLDPAYFFDRAVRYLDRRDLHRARKYFQRAAEVEPENPANHCNLAGVLSELGRYQESNDVLSRVLSDIDASMAECHFYMANNYANLEEYEEAEESALRYLEADPDGEFSEEAIEMIDVLVKEFGGGRVLREHEEEHQRQAEKRDYARKLLEIGKFGEAIEHLEQEIVENPEDLAPRNNLALAYYYMGKVDEALEAVDSVLQQDPSNIHARCNLAVFYQHLGDQESLQNVLNLLRKLRPFHPDHIYKLATTMGILDEHESAYRLFRCLIRLGSTDPAVKHAVAVAALNIGRPRVAKRLWEELQREDTESKVAGFYLDRLVQCERSETPMPAASYQYHIPFHEQFRSLREQLESGASSALKQDSAFRTSLFWALFNGDIETKIQVIQTLALMPDPEVINLLQEFVRSPDEIDQLKRLAVYVLSRVAPKEATRAVFRDNDVGMWLRASRQAGMEREWNQVADRCVEKMKERYDDTVCSRVRQIWDDFMRAVPERPMRMGRWESWAAGLEYVTLRASNLPVRQADVAEHYGVSVGMVSRRARFILSGGQDERE